MSRPPLTDYGFLLRKAQVRLTLLAAAFCFVCFAFAVVQADLPGKLVDFLTTMGR